MEIDVTKIKIVGRSPRDFGDMRSFMRDIQEFGQLQNIVVEKIDDSDSYVLICGGRRLEAFKRLGIQKIEADIRTNLTEINRKEMEMMENISRKDLSPMEKQRAIRDLYKLKEAHYNENTSMLGRRKYTQCKFADEHKMSQSEVSRAIKLAEASDRHPQVDGAMSLQDAERKLRVLEIEYKENRKHEVNLTMMEDPLKELIALDRQFRFIFMNATEGDEHLINLCHSLLSEFGTIMVQPVEDTFDNPIFAGRPVILQELGKEDYQEIYYISKFQTSPFEGKVLTFERSYTYNLPHAHSHVFWERILRATMKKAVNPNILFLNPMDLAMTEFVTINNWKAEYMFTDRTYFKQLKGHTI